MSGAAPGAPAPSRAPYALIVLLGAALMINYVDRGTISTASPLIKSEFRLDDFQMGLLLSAFFATYVLSQPLMGILVDRIGAARVLAGGFTLWSVGTFLAGLSGGVVSLVALRLVMGVGESVCYPSGFALISQRVADAHRARATSIMQLGSVVGPALGAFVGGLVMIRYGWRTMFMALGLVSLLWLIPWAGQLRVTAPVRPADAGAVGPRWIDIVRQRALWGTVFGNFCSNYAFYFVFTWVPLYLVDERGLSLDAMKNVQSLIYVMDSASIVATGWLIDWWIRRGATPSLAYKTALSLSAAGVGLCLLVLERRRGGGGRGAAARDRSGGRSQLAFGGRADAALCGAARHRPVDGHAKRDQQHCRHPGPERDRLSHQAQRRPLHGGTVGHGRGRAARAARVVPRGAPRGAGAMEPRS